MTEAVDPRAALASFAEYLSALRASMPAVEQSLLDEVIAGTAFEVEAHSLAVRSIPQDFKTAEDRLARLQGAAAVDGASAEDVEAHALKGPGRVPVDDKMASAGRLDPATATDDDIEDVQAHALKGPGRVPVDDKMASAGRLDPATAAADDDIEDVQAHALAGAGRVPVDDKMASAGRLDPATAADDDIEDVQAHALKGPGRVPVDDKMASAGRLNPTAAAADDELEDVQAHAMINTAVIAQLRWNPKRGFEVVESAVSLDRTAVN
ncbi:MAG: hypothetical protein R3293_18760 [Candidatus Promineifilaceae bacterium]|nr:hypothetical protein [Candidatus Promineifilaceae bacterium]